MSVTFNTYSGLKAAIPAWLARAVSGVDPILDPQFDNFLANMERRMYYGYAVDDPANPLRSDPLRIPEMETVETAFSLSSGTVAQPATFLELISAYNNSTPGPIGIVAQRHIDGYASNAFGRVGGLIAISGTNFRVFDAPTTAITATLRYYQKLTTPTASTANAILTNYSDVYLYGCLVEATIFTQDAPSAQAYLALYNASVAGLNARTQRITASANPVLRVRGQMTP
jgi:hypothetical protein